MFYNYRLLSKEQYAALESTTDGTALRALLAEYFEISYPDEKKQKISLDYHFYNYAFCKDSAFDGLKTSTFMSIMQTIWKVRAAAYESNSIPACSR